jgi:hypothetical protein
MTGLIQTSRFSPFSLIRFPENTWAGYRRSVTVQFSKPTVFSLPQKKKPKD